MVVTSDFMILVYPHFEHYFRSFISLPFETSGEVFLWTTSIFFQFCVVMATIGTFIGNFDRVESMGLVADFLK